MLQVFFWPAATLFPSEEMGGVSLRSWQLPAVLVLAWTVPPPALLVTWMFPSTMFPITVTDAVSFSTVRFPPMVRPAEHSGAPPISTGAPEPLLVTCTSLPTAAAQRVLSAPAGFAVRALTTSFPPIPPPATWIDAGPP